MLKGISPKEQSIIKNILDKYKSNYSFFYYGSRVKGSFEKTSDLDILIKGQTQMPLAMLADIKNKFDESNLPYIVNFTDFNAIDEKFYNLIKKDLVDYSI